ncbi:MAG: hypothetical protein JRE40_04700 [Deltaproteobacteria bacterium]|nr:hypothetical protein [Deltaproteobacteria bacterium]
MALKDSYMVKQAMGEDTLELEAGTDESFLVRNVEVDNTTNVNYAKVLIDRMTVGYFDVYNMYSNPIYFGNERSAYPQLLAYLGKLGVFKGYPIATGQKFLVDITGATTKNIRVTYERYDPGDITKDMPNGTEATEYIFLNYGTNTDAIAAGEYGAVDKTLNPAEFPDFPFGAVVPSGMEIDILAVLMQTHKAGTYIGDQQQYLRMMKEREVLFDEDKLGLYTAHGMGNWPSHAENYERPINLFPAPLTFPAGTELSVEVKALTGGAGIGAGKGYIAFLERVRRV